MRARWYRTAASAAVLAILALAATGSAFAVTITTFTPTTDFIPEEANNCVGTQITINGTGFVNDGGTPVVQFNGATAVDVSVGSDVVLYARVPQGATGGTITVTTPTGTATSTATYTVVPCASHGGPTNIQLVTSTAAKASITGFAPTKGKTGTKVTITGKNFTGTTSVKFGSTKATFTAVSATKITATVPAGARTGKIRVTTSGGTVLSTTSFIAQ